MYLDTLLTIRFLAIVLLYFDRLPPLCYAAKMNIPGARILLPGPDWVILHMIYTPIMSKSLVDFVTYRAVTNVLTL